MKNLAGLLVVALLGHAGGAFTRRGLRAAERTMTVERGQGSARAGNAGGLRNAKSTSDTVNANSNGNSNANANSNTNANGNAVVGAEAQMSTGEAKFKAQVTEMMSGMLLGKGPAPSDIAKILRNQMDLKEAVTRLDGRLPQDVSALLKMSSREESKAQGRFDEDSLQKARRILNGMIFAAWKELDDVVFECKEFQERNRGTFEQVVGDIARLGSQLAILGDNRVEASEGIMEQDRLRKEAEATIESRTKQYNQQKALDEHEMAIRRNDLAVFDMILMMTACQDSNALVQIDSHGAKGNAKMHHELIRSNHSLKVCKGTGGHLQLRFDDPKLEARVERLLTPEAKRALREALGEVSSKEKSQQAQVPQEVDLLELGQVPSAEVNDTTPGLPTFEAEVSPVTEEPAPDGQWKKCVDGTPNCGLLHDLMSIEWGRFRDSFDELATEMKKNDDEYEKFMEVMNNQLTVINDLRTKHMEALAETISGINADTEEMNEKDEQRRELDAEYTKHMAEFKAACTEILYTKICAVRKVRNEIMMDSTVSPPSKMSDCDFTDWYPKDGICIGVTGAAITCDDTCPQPDPYACGGLETMTRDVVIAPNEYGMACPQLERPKKCKQIKCPVDCVESEWSGWSKCSKECESGVRVRTRSILTKAKNGGKACDTVQEEEVCNTGSCDRDCRLDTWTGWSPCSMACSGGITERIKKVVVPIRGRGMCPTSKSADRFERKDCNTQACVGDEICIAHQDLVLAVDGSGSLRESGFEIVRSFAANLTMKYKSMYYGKEDMKMGLVFFGNGQLTTQPDGSTVIAEALSVQGLTADIDIVRTKIQETQWLRGFTNMAQAFHAADVMLGQTGRPDAQSAVLVISDGKYSMAYQTAEKARELKDKSVMIFLAPITAVKDKELKVFRSFSSFPHETNYERIPGLDALAFNPDLFAGKLIAKFCPKAISPSQLTQKEDEQEYMMIHEGGYPSDSCGTWTWYGRGFNMDDCATQAREDDRLAFAFGKGPLMGGGCYTEAIDVTQEFWDAAQADRRSPPCENGQWVPNPYFDTFIIKPTSAPVIEPASSA